MTHRNLAGGPLTQKSSLAAAARPRKVTLEDAKELKDTQTRRDNAGTGPTEAQSSASITQVAADKEPRERKKLETWDDTQEDWETR